jgi:hypothetical protein
MVRKELVAGLLEWSLSCLILMEFKARSWSKANAKLRGNHHTMFTPFLSATCDKSLSPVTIGALSSSASRIIVESTMLRDLPSSSGLHVTYLVIDNYVLAYLEPHQDHEVLRALRLKSFKGGHAT